MPLFLHNKIPHKGDDLMENLNNRISINPSICSGKPCIAGHRIMVHQILALLEHGYSFDQIIKDHYPDINKEDIQACLHYAKSLILNEEIHYYDDVHRN